MLLCAYRWPLGGWKRQKNYERCQIYEAPLMNCIFGVFK